MFGYKILTEENNLLENLNFFNLKFFGYSFMKNLNFLNFKTKF